MVRRHQSLLRKHLRKSDVRKGPRVFHLCTDQRYTWSCRVWTHQTVVPLCRSHHEISVITHKSAFPKWRHSVEFPQQHSHRPCRAPTCLSLHSSCLTPAPQTGWLTQEHQERESLLFQIEIQHGFVDVTGEGGDYELVTELIKATSPTRPSVRREDRLCSKSPRLLCLLMIEIGRIFGWELKLGQHGLGRASETSVCLSHA